MSGGVSTYPRKEEEEILTWLCCSTGDSNSGLQKKRRISEGSLLVQDPKEKTPASGTSNLRFLWCYSLWDICLREGSNAMNAREE